jgi:hypothetical protein
MNVNNQSLINVLKHPGTRLITGVSVVVAAGIIDQFIGIFSGGLLSLIAASIICTGGVGLIFWLPVSFVIGTVLTIPVIFMLSGGKVKDITEDSQAVRKYIAEARRFGMDNNSIRANLLQAGWKEDLIKSQL